MKKMIALVSSLVLGISSMANGVSGTVTANAAGDNRTGFVTTNGTQFMLDGSTFYYAGTNNYYINFKPQYDVDQVMEDASAMGLKVIRTWGHLDAGVITDEVSDDGYTVFTGSVDGPGEKEGIYYQYFDEELGRPVVNEGKNGLEKLDYVLYKAEQEGLRVLITFTNNWEAFGGMSQYVKWAQLAGENVNGHDDFYTNETIKGWYKDYVETLLNHENIYTHEKYKDDPNVFSWELANEPRCESDAGCENNIVADWATEMAAFVKSIDSNHMLAVGDEGFYNYGYNDFPEGNHKYVYHGSSGIDWLSLIDIPNIDYGTIHVYCDQWGLTKEQGNFWFKKHGEDAAAANKPVIVEEFGWKDRAERADVYTEWYDIFEGNTYDGVEYAGTNYWMIASLTSDGTLYPDYDTYTVYYKGDANGNPTEEARDVIMAHAERMAAKNSENSITPKKADYDIINPADMTFKATLEMGEISGLEFNGSVLTEGTDYTISGTTVILSSSVLSGLELGNYKLTLLTTEGIQPTVLIRVYDSHKEDAERSIIDDFEGYDDSTDVSSAYSQNSSGDKLNISLEAERVKNGNAAMKYEYSVANGGPGYCGATKGLGSADWSGFDGIKFWILSDGSNRETTIQFVDGAGAYWESIQKVTEEEGWMEVKIPFSDFNNQQWGVQAETPTLEGVKEISIYAGPNGNPGTGVWYFDDIGLYSNGGSVVIPDAEAVNTTSTFDVKNPSDVIFTIITNGHALKGIEYNGTALVQGTDFAVNGSQFRFNQSYLSSLESGTYSYNISFSTCPDIIVTITVSDVNETVTTTTTITTTTTTSTETTTTESGTTTSTSVVIPENVKYGDVNVDGKITMVDMVYMNKYLTGAIKFNEQQLANGDCAKNGDVDSGDASALLLFMGEKIESLPVIPD